MTFTYGSVDEEKTDRHEVLTDQYSERAAVINILSLFTGTGMLSLPYAAARAGWLGGILILAAVQGTFMYTLYILALSFGASGASSYAELGEIALSARKLITLSVFLEMMLALTSLEVSIALNCHRIYSAPNLSWLCLSTIVSLSLSLSKRWISAASTIGVFMITIILAAMIASGYNNNAFKEYKMYDAAGLEISLGLTLFCCGGHAAFSSIYNNMGDKNDVVLKRVISWAALLLFAMYSTIMLVGYFLYGEQTAMPITLNIGNTDLDTQILQAPRRFALFLRVVAAIAIVVNLQVTIPLLVFPLRALLMYAFMGSERVAEENIFNNMAAAAVVLLTAACLAEYFSTSFAPLCAAIGLLSTTVNSVLLPLLFYHRLKGEAAVKDIKFHSFIAIVTLVAAGIGLRHI